MINMSRAWEKKKIWVPDRIRTYDLPNAGRALYPLELRRIRGQRGLILGSFLTRCRTVWWKNEKIVVNFKLGETNVKTKWSACHERGTKKISESQTIYILSNIYFVQWLKQNQRCFCLISSCFIRTARNCIRIARLHSCKSSIICCTHCSYVSEIMPTNYAWLAQLGERQCAEREVAGSNPGRTKSQGL